MKIKNKIKIMSCTLVLISNFAWSQQVTKVNKNCYVINKDIVGTGGSPSDVIGTGGSPSEIIGIGGSPSEIIGIGGITTYCTPKNSSGTDS